MNRLLLVLIIFFVILLLPETIQAKVLPQAVKSGQKATAVKSAGIGVSPRLRSDRRALIVYFSNLQNAKSVSYALTYRTNIQEEGAIGSLNLTGLNYTSQELLFGTCSKGVCKYHTGITNAKLEVSYTLKSGKKYLKRFKVRV